MSSVGRRFQFGPFVLDVDERVLYRAGELVPLTPKALETLLVLVEAVGHVVDKDDLLRKVWPDTFVEEGSLTRNISAIRKALGEPAGEPVYIDTIPKRGYRFAAPVREISDREGRESPNRELRAGMASGLHGAASPAPASTAGRGWAVIGRWLHRSWGGRLALTALLVVIVTVAVRVSRAGSRAPATASTATFVGSVAVLPFRTIGVGADEAYLGAGMADALLTRLAAMSRTSGQRLRVVQLSVASGRDPIEAARRLELDTLVEASVQRSGDRIRVAARLLRVRDGSPLWADTFDGPFTDVFAMQDSFSDRIGRVLLIHVASSNASAKPRHGTSNPDAYQHYLRGRYFWSRTTVDDTARAIREFEAALALDRAYGSAHAGLADCYLQALQSGRLSADIAIQRAEEAASKALSLDASLPEAHTALARVKSVRWQWAAAEAEFRLALSLDPGSAVSHQAYAATLLAPSGRFDEAIAELKRALELDPLSLSVNANLGAVYHYARRYDEAILQHRRTLELGPGYVPAHYDLGMSYEQKGQYDLAVAEFERALQQPSIEPLVLASLAHAQATSGRTVHASRTAQRLAEISRQREVSPYLLAIVDIGFGRRSGALANLESACAARFPFAPWINVDPRFDVLRQDPRFVDLLRRVGLGVVVALEMHDSRHPSS